jgi:hypothetical protein
MVTLANGMFSQPWQNPTGLQAYYKALPIQYFKVTPDCIHKTSDFTMCCSPMYGQTFQVETNIFPGNPELFGNDHRLSYNMISLASLLFLQY